MTSNGSAAPPGRGLRNFPSARHVCVAMHRHAGLGLVLAGALAALGLSPAASAAKPKALPTLLAKAPDSGVAKRIELGLLDPAQFRVVRRPSAASVTLGWPARRPCALTTLTLAILLGQSDAAAAARAVVPEATAEGSATRRGKLNADGTQPVFTGAWRQHSTIEASSVLRVRAVAATPLLGRYGDPAGGLLQLRLDGRTVRGSNRCSGPNVFRLGPNLAETIITAA